MPKGHNDVRRPTRRYFSAEDKSRMVLDGLRGEDGIAELCRKEGIAQSLYYVWSKEFMKAGEMTKHTDDFKREAVQIALTSGLSLCRVASDLGAGLSTLCK